MVRDPVADMLAAKWSVAGADQIVSALFGAQGPFADHWTPSLLEQEALTIQVRAPTICERVRDPGQRVPKR